MHMHPLHQWRLVIIAFLFLSEWMPLFTYVQGDIDVIDVHTNAFDSNQSVTIAADSHDDDNSSLNPAAYASSSSSSSSSSSYRRILFHSHEIDTLVSPSIHTDRVFHSMSSSHWRNKSENDHSNRYPFLIQFESPIRANVLNEVELLISQRLEHLIPWDSYVVYIPHELAKSVASVNGVVWVGLYKPEYKFHPNIRKPVGLSRSISDLSIYHDEPHYREFVGQTNGSVRDAGRAHFRKHRDPTRPQAPNDLNVILIVPHTDYEFIEKILDWKARFQAGLSPRVFNTIVNITVVSSVKLRVHLSSSIFLTRIASMIATFPSVYYIERRSFMYHNNKFARALAESSINVPSYNNVIISQANIQQPQQDNGKARSATGMLTIDHPELTGQGQVIGMADSGIDWNSCFFYDYQFPQGPPGLRPWQSSDQNPIRFNETTDNAHRKIVQYVSYADKSDANGHGTHVAGSLVGAFPSSSLSSSPVSSVASLYSGMAPSARLSVFDAGAGIANVIDVPEPYDTELFPWAFDAGARIHSNSWGGADPHYTSESASVDKYIYEHDDFLVVMAAGNSGVDGKQTVAAPATAKNIITVGASTSSRSSFQQTFCEGGILPNAEFCEASTSSSFSSLFYDENIAGFSSQGPTSDGRIKPDLVAPGFFVVSALNNQPQQGQSCAQNDTSKLLQYQAGTSMAAPIVSGHLAIIRQYLMEGYYPTGQKNSSNSIIPSAALLKAMAIAGTRSLSGSVDTSAFLFSDADAPTLVPLSPPPSNVQGWGQIDLNRSLYLPGDESQTLIYRDANNLDPYLAPGGHQEFTFCMIAPLSDGSASKVTLVWTDYPGSPLSSSVLVNDLDLTVTQTSSTASGAATVLYPNSLNTADRLNNIETVNLPNVIGVSFIASVQAYKLQTANQKFALVVTGNVKAGMCESRFSSMSSSPSSSSPCSSSSSSSSSSYWWVYSPWSSCSRSCNTGIATRTVSCYSSCSKGLVDDSYCNTPAANAGSKPISIQMCNNNTCGSITYHWYVSPWSPCSQQCDGGTQTRFIRCDSSNGYQGVDAKYCKNIPRPSTSSPCNTASCTSTFSTSSISSTPSLLPFSSLSSSSSSLSSSSTYMPSSQTAIWQTSSSCSSSCSASCGTGQCSRSVTCTVNNVKVNEAFCAGLTKPSIFITCNTQACPKSNLKSGENGVLTETFSLRVSPWTSCSVGCGGGYQNRTITCVSSLGYYSDDLSMCQSLSNTNVPLTLSRSCNSDVCPYRDDSNYEWVVGTWSDCDRLTSTMTRWVVCATSNGVYVDTAKCESHAGSMPGSVLSCQSNPDSNSTWSSDLLVDESSLWSLSWSFVAGTWGNPSKWCSPQPLTASVQTRTLWCLGPNGLVANSRTQCENALQASQTLATKYVAPPIFTQMLSRDACEISPSNLAVQWATGEWVCSRSNPCEGEEVRNLYCIDSITGIRMPDASRCLAITDASAIPSNVRRPCSTCNGTYVGDPDYRKLYGSSASALTVRDSFSFCFSFLMLFFAQLWID